MLLESNIDLEVGVSAWASGNYMWKGTTGSLIINATNKDK